MTDSEKLDAILKMVKEIREAIGDLPEVPPHLWSDHRKAEEANRQWHQVFRPGHSCMNCGADLSGLSPTAPVHQCMPKSY